VAIFGLAWGQSDWTEVPRRRSGCIISGLSGAASERQSLRPLHRRDRTRAVLTHGKRSTPRCHNPDRGPSECFRWTIPHDILVNRMKGTRTNTVAHGGGKDIVAHSINGLPRCWLKWTARLNRMSPFRSKIGRWLALTALALQLTLSFAHVHLMTLHGTDYGTAISGATVKTHKLPTPEPADPSDHCAICALIQLAGSTLLPHVPQVPELFEFRASQLAGDVALLMLCPRRTAFQSRAPPPA
jgi:hypothetical protein